MISRNHVLQQMDKYYELKKAGAIPVAEPLPVREVTTEYNSQESGIRATQIKIVESKRYQDGTHIRVIRVMEPHKEVQL